MNGDETSKSASGLDGMTKEVLLRVFVETFDVYVRSIAEIAAELGLSDELTVEDLMTYWLSLPESDNLVRDFIRGDLTMFSLADQTRQMVERDLGRMELEPAGIVPSGALTSRLGKKLDAIRRQESGARIAMGKASDLEKFIHENPEILKQVSGSNHEILVMWVMLYLMHATKARERGHRAASEFLEQHPAIRERIQAVAVRQRERVAQGPPLQGTTQAIGTRIGSP